MHDTGQDTHVMTGQSDEITCDEIQQHLLVQSLAREMMNFVQEHSAGYIGIENILDAWEHMDECIESSTLSDSEFAAYEQAYVNLATKRFQAAVITLQDALLQPEGGDGRPALARTEAEIKLAIEEPRSPLSLIPVLKRIRTNGHELQTIYL